jgi:hypothetical protein
MPGNSKKARRTGTTTRKYRFIVSFFSENKIPLLDRTGGFIRG